MTISTFDKDNHWRQAAVVLPLPPTSSDLSPHSKVVKSISTRIEKGIMGISVDIDRG